MIHLTVTFYRVFTEAWPNLRFQKEKRHHHNDAKWKKYNFCTKLKDLFFTKKR